MTVHYRSDRNFWRYDFERNGQRYSGKCVDANGKPVTSRRDAVEAEQIEIRKVTMAPKLPSAAGVTLASVLELLIPVWELKPSWANRELHVKELLKFFGPLKIMSTFNAGEVERYREHLITGEIEKWTGGTDRKADDPENRKYWKKTGRKRSANTANCYLIVLRSVLERASKIHDKITGESALPHPPTVKEFEIKKRKARPITDEALTHVMAILPQHTIEAIMLTLFFGFRRAEVFGLQVGQVSFEAGGVNLLAEHVKDSEDAFLPGSPEAMAYLRGLVAQAKARGVTHLITYRPYHKDPKAQAKEPWRPIKSPKRAWQRAMVEIKEKFGRQWRWHDIRAAFITHVAVTSGPAAAQALARHSDYDTTKMYVEIADQVRRDAADRLADRPALKNARNQHGIVSMKCQCGERAPCSKHGLQNLVGGRKRA